MTALLQPLEIDDRNRLKRRHAEFGRVAGIVDVHERGVGRRAVSRELATADSVRARARESLAARRRPAAGGCRHKTAGTGGRALASPVRCAITVLVPYSRTSRLSSPSFARTRAANSLGLAAGVRGKSAVRVARSGRARGPVRSRPGRAGCAASAGSESPPCSGDAMSTTPMFAIAGSRGASLRLQEPQHLAQLLDVGRLGIEDRVDAEGERFRRRQRRGAGGQASSSWPSAGRAETARRWSRSMAPWSPARRWRRSARRARHLLERRGLRARRARRGKTLRRRALDAPRVTKSRCPAAFRCEAGARASSARTISAARTGQHQETGPRRVRSRSYRDFRVLDLGRCRRRRGRASTRIRCGPARG